MVRMAKFIGGKGKEEDYAIIWAFSEHAGPVILPIYPFLGAIIAFRACCGGGRAAKMGEEATEQLAGLQDLISAGGLGVRRLG